jgi:hypothetical protein
METDIYSWLEKLETRKPTANMMIWMSYYDKICDKLCCNSTDCGSIRCSGCLSYLTSLPPLTRYQCIECEILPPEAEFDNRPTICQTCFNDPNKLHHHTKWLKVDEKGIHSFLDRQVGVAELKQLTLLDFPIVKNKLSSPCAICYDDFSEDMPAVSFPGCMYQHGNSQYSDQFGYIDLKTYIHAECLMYWYQRSKRDYYTGELDYCEVCRFTALENKWRSDFIKIKNYIDSSDNIEEAKAYVSKALTVRFDNCDINDSKSINNLTASKLIELHPQTWLRNIIKDIFQL